MGPRSFCFGVGDHGHLPCSFFLGAGGQGCSFSLGGCPLLHGIESDATCTQNRQQDQQNQWSKNFLNCLFPKRPMILVPMP